MKKLLVSIFILSLVAMPSATHAGFFDFFKINQKAQVTSAVKSDSLVTQLQKILFAQGIYKGNADGYIGSKTISAIKTFQRQNKLPVTGLLDQTTVNTILKRLPGGLGTAYECTPTSRPHIRITSPNGGEVYQAGQPITVTWTDCNIPDGIDIGITLLNLIEETPLPSYANHVQIEQTPNDGTHIISAATQVGLPSFEYGNKFKVRLNYVVTEEYDYNTYGNNPSWMQGGDESNNLFSIVSGGISCVVTTEETNPFVSSIPTTNVAPFSDSWTTGYNEMSVFRIQNPTNCPMTIPKIAVVVASTDGLQFIEKEDLRLKTLDDGNMYAPTNVGPNYPNSNASFSILDLDIIPANSYKDYGVGTVDLHYFDPYSMSSNLNMGGVAVGIGQVDFELPGLSLPVWNGNTNNPTPTLGPIWGSVESVLP